MARYERASKINIVLPCSSIRGSGELRKMLLVAFIMILIFVSSVVGVGLYNEYMIANTGRIPLSFDYIVAEMIAEINETEIYNTVYRLQNFTTRVYGHSGNTLAAEYIYNRLKTISGFTVEYQGSYKNVIATLPGTDPASSQIYVVGAHYDSKSSDPSNAPGATDNGGGVAIVLEFARIMSQYRFEHTLKFALWNYEEGGLFGSTDYAQYALANGLNVSLYFNYDSACYDPDNRFVLDIMYNSQSSWVKDMMTEYNTLYAIGFSLTYNVHTCSSDHRPFWSKGYTAVMTHEESHGPAHSQEDTIDKVSTSYAKKNGQLGMSVLAKLAQLESGARSFRQSHERR